MQISVFSLKKLIFFAEKHKNHEITTNIYPQHKKSPKS